MICLIMCQITEIRSKSRLSQSIISGENDFFYIRNMYKGCEIDNYMLFDICFINYSILHGITGAGNIQCTKFPQTPIYTINIIPRFVVN